MATRWIALWLACAALNSLAQDPRDRMEQEVLHLKALRSANEFDSLRSVAQHLLEELSPAPGATRYEAEWHLAFALSVNDDPLGAMEHAQNALLIARELKDTTRMLGSFYQLTKLNVEGRHYREADHHRREHLALARMYDRDTTQLVLALNSMGSMHSRLANNDSAEYYYREGLRVLGDEPHIVKQALLGNLASMLGAKGEHEEAVRLLRLALAGVDSTDVRNKAWAFNSLGQALLRGKRYHEALDALHTSDSLNNAGGGALDLAIELAEIRAECLEAMGDPAGAYEWIKHARDLQDTLFDRSMNEQLLELEQRFGARLKEEEIQRLDAQNREQDERLRLRDVQLYGSLALAVLAVLGIVLLWRNYKQKRRNVIILAQLNELLQLKVLRSQMNPHFIHNSLNAIHGLVLKGEHDKARDYLQGFARLLRMVLDHSVRDHIALSEEIDFLREYLKLEALRFADGLHWKVEADAALLDEDPQLSALLVQPFVENAVWHGLAPKAGEKKLLVLFTEAKDHIVCTIEDNGVGRHAERPASTDGHKSIGLQITGERLQLLAHRMEGQGGYHFDDLKDDQGRPAGTRVTLRLLEGGERAADVSSQVAALP